MKLARIKKLIFLNLQQSHWLSRTSRTRFVRWAGVNISQCKDVRIGQGCIFDTTYPEDIIIKSGAHIGPRCIILTHFKNPKKLGLDTASGGYDYGKVIIGEHAWIGACSVICKSVTIGKGAIIGACSVITKDIPDYEVWAGNPARFIRKRL